MLKVPQFPTAPGQEFLVSLNRQEVGRLEASPEVCSQKSTGD